MRFTKTVLLVLLAVMALSAMSCASAGGLPGFGAEMGARSNPLGGQIRIPYTSMVNYYGYVKPGSAPDATVGGKKMYYLYVWIPLVAPELGIRMLSPSPEGLKPEAKDFIGKDWAEAEKDPNSYFDTWISWERSSTVLNESDIVSKGKAGSWLKFDSNDDSSELPAQPSGNRYNSVLRVVSNTSDPLKSLVRGLYRIGFTTYKVGEVQGSFLAQVGAPIDLPGVVIGSSLEEVMEKTKKK
jgi:hypothetical protein